MPRVATKQKEPSQAQIEARAAGAERLAQHRKVHPVSIRKTHEAAEVRQSNPRRLKSTGPAREALSPGIVEPVEREVSPEKLENLKFMEDVLKVRVQETTNPNDDPWPTVWNAGRQFTFVRGTEVEVKRKFVEVLARMRKKAFGQRLVRDQQGIGHYEYPSTTGLVHNFQVTYDPAGDKGKRWLDSILSEQT